MCTEKGTEIRKADCLFQDLNSKCNQNIQCPKYTIVLKYITDVLMRVCAIGSFISSV